MMQLSSVYYRTNREQQAIRNAGKWCQMAAVLVLLLCNLSRTALADDSQRTKDIVTEVCAACHNLDGNSIDPTFPKLAGRNPDYLVRELKVFISGQRKSDLMGPIVATLNTDDLRPLAEYFGAQKPTSGQIKDVKAAEIGRKLFQNGDESRDIPACAGCHNIDASGNSRFPRLAGQHREYLIAQLNNFKNDVRNYSSARLMRELTKRMSDEEIAAVADYLNGL